MTAPDDPGPPRAPAAGPQVWGIVPAVVVGCAIAAVAGVAWALLAGSPADRLVAGALAVFAAVAAGCCLTMRRRLTADAAGLVVRGPGGTRRLPWGEITDIAVVRRSRWGVASTTLEIDLDLPPGAGDADPDRPGGLVVLGRFDLGADPEDVARTLKELRRGR